ncbi:elongation factor P maturation arginine rhamnosyltransferase EarP [Kingella denitrificans]|uniref:elongation factor P maturation arginine rhamnosyltransferase EarP n=1 Tax=Kingella denitrificans TaxID=502 RepID=UPI0028D8992E|nr:elongation factor P maturation arginine rhamnosyltransferase EarP [Kingella denitrificans]
MKNPTSIPMCWLFCTVIDNFGDIGVSWRLARQLQQRLGWQVCLWLDDLAALRTIVPDAPEKLPARHDGIELRAWQAGVQADMQGIPKPHIIIETFACDLPAAVLSAIRQTRAVWLNWEYLSAEDWAVRTHAMSSLQADGYPKYFWQMGFVPESGGLLRETDTPPDVPRRGEGESSLHLFAFGYAGGVWAKWCAAWQDALQPVTLHVAGNPVWQSLPNDLTEHGGAAESSLHVCRQDFVPQSEFDRLLQRHDVLIIRGEDSFVRAQLAGRPFFWHIYPQEAQAHLDKLDAFWQLYWRQAQAADDIVRAHTVLSLELNGAHTLSDGERVEAWRTLLLRREAWQRAARQWQQYLYAQSDAATRLAQWLCRLPAQSPAHECLQRHAIIKP